MLIMVCSIFIDSSVLQTNSFNRDTNYEITTAVSNEKEINRNKQVYKYKAKRIIIKADAPIIELMINDHNGTSILQNLHTGLDSTF